MGALAVIDDALEQGRVTATSSEERELQELALAIQADSPEPDPAFAATLAERVSAGFPHEPSPVAEGGRRAAERVRGTLRSAAGRLSGLTPRLTPRYAGGVAAVLLALAVGGGIISQSVGTGGDTAVTSVVAPELGIGRARNRARGHAPEMQADSALPKDGRGRRLAGRPGRSLERLRRGRRGRGSRRGQRARSSTPASPAAVPSRTSRCGSRTGRSSDRPTSRSAHPRTSWPTRPAGLPTRPAVTVASCSARA